MESEEERNEISSIEKVPGWSAQQVRCRLLESVLEIRSDTIAYYNIEQNNYCLLEIEEPLFGCGIKIAAEWGPMPFQLTTRNRAGEILCQAGFGWKASYNEEKGQDYWLITREDIKDRQQSLLYVRFSNLTVYNEGVARLKFCYTADGHDSPFSYVQLQKTPCVLRVESFEPEEGTVMAAANKDEKNAVLNWCVLGSERCLLNPGNIEIPPVGSISVSVTENSIFTLTAFYQEKCVEKSAIVYTYGEIWHDLFLAEPHKYYAGCSTVIRWKLQGRASDVSLWSGGKELAENLELQGEFKDEASMPEYVLSFQRDGKQTELIYEREPDEREAVLLFEASYHEQQDAFCLKWDTVKTKRTELFVFFRKKSAAREEELQFVNRSSFVKISSERSGEERWRLEHDRSYPVLFILRTENGYGEEVEKHIECRG